MSTGAATLPLNGAVTFASHTDLRTRLDVFIAAGGGIVDWAAVDELDSSALSLILHTRRLATAGGYAIRHANLPPALDALAELYGVRELLERC
ncbi:MAG: STAS domain-containing protein [Gammaproteobacteria bacterium]